MSISTCFKKNVSGQHCFQECITEFPGGLASVLQEYQRNFKENRKAIPLKTTKFLFFNAIHVCSKQFKQYRKVKFLLYFSLATLCVLKFSLHLQKYISISINT